MENAGEGRDGKRKRKKRKERREQGGLEKDRNGKEENSLR